MVKPFSVLIPAFLPAVVVVPSPIEFLVMKVEDAAPTNIDIIFYEVG